MRRRLAIALPVLGVGIGLGATAFHGQVAHAKGGQTIVPHFKAAAFDRTARLTSGDRTAVVSGPIECSPSSAAAAVRVTLVRRARPPAYGTGAWRGSCRKGKWTATITSKEAFTGGSARACALGVETRSGHAVDALLWCRTIRLEAS